MPNDLTGLEMLAAVDQVRAEYPFEDDDRVRQQLVMQVGMLRYSKHGVELHYQGPQELVLKHGLDWESPHLQNLYPMDEPRMCFFNATQLATWQRDLTYCEGYAWCGTLAVHHAWCVTPTGCVIDTTWPDDEKIPRSEWQYVGVPFEMEYLFYRLEKNGEYGILDDWQEHFDILRQPLPVEAIAAPWRPS